MFKNSCRGSRTHPTQTRLNHFQICKFYSWKCFSLTDNEQLLSIRLLNNHRHCSSGGYLQIRINAPGWNRTTVKGFGDLFLTIRQAHILLMWCGFEPHMIYNRRVPTPRFTLLTSLWEHLPNHPHPLA